MSSSTPPPAPMGELAEVDREAIEQQLSLDDAHSIMTFGAGAQQELAGVTDQILDGVKNQDVGQAGEALNDVIATLRGFDVDALAAQGKRRGLLSWLFSASRPLAKFLQRYESVRGQIDAITDRLEQHKTTLLTDLTRLDRLYQGSLDCFHSLDGYIAVGEARLARVDAEAIPELQRKADSSGEVLDAQALRDLQATRDDLERRLHDLRLTRQVTMQSLPGIRLVQENNKGLVNRINSVLTNTVPLWRQQLATAVAVYRSGQATRSVEAASDLTNEMLEANARDLKVANAESRRAIERGALDVESVKAANQTLIETIEESLTIAEEGRQARVAAREELQAAEAQLRNALATAAGREPSESNES